MLMTSTSALAKLGPACTPQVLQQLLASPEARQLVAVLNSSPDFQPRFELLMKMAMSGMPPTKPAFQRQLALVGGAVLDTGHLPEVLGMLVAKLQEMGQLPAAIPKVKIEQYVAQLSGAIDAELSSRGLTAASKGVQYETDLQMMYKVGPEVRDELARARQAWNGEGSFHESAAFREGYERLTGTKFVDGNRVELLIDGPASFARAEKMLKEAAPGEPIYIMSWAFYDDVTGKKFADLLIEAKKADHPVYIMVDGQVAMKAEHAGGLARMEENGAQVVRWMSPDPLRRFDGQHMKGMRVGNQVKGGGMNFGDVYSHLNPDMSVARWRDTDLYAQGPIALEFDKLFVRLWNEQVDYQQNLVAQGKLKTVHLDLKNLALSQVDPVSMRAGDETLGIVHHRPGQDYNLLKGHLYAIEATTSGEILIENAYLILNPAIYRALLRALGRNVTVKVLTNSAKSIDEAIITNPIMQTLNRLLANGAETYVKAGTNTLHSKTMGINGVYFELGSENLHPRSVRYEMEVMFVGFGKRVAGKVQEMITTDIAQAERITTPVTIDESLPVKVGGQLFKDQF